ncbi:cystatin-C [Gadus morhua]|uniref:cystatin-C n=1 Tax=Gadus morhua TaxID=8049 RepID=UPI0011B4DC38|nr:cystatin-C-like [Gadus morhua]
MLKIMTSFTLLCILALAAAAALVDGAAQPMTGEPRAIPQNRTDVVRAARFAVANFNEANIDDIYAYKILNITSAKIQIVAGVNYILDVRLGRTSYKRSTPSTEQCVLQTQVKVFFVRDHRFLVATLTSLHKNCFCEVFDGGSEAASWRPTTPAGEARVTLDP